MRVLVVDPYYPAFLQQHYTRYPELRGQRYEVQLRALLDESFGTTDAYSRGFRQLGHEAEEVIANCPDLQAAWAREHGPRRLIRSLARIATRLPSRLARHLLLERVTAAQIEHFEPDVIYLQDVTVLKAPLVDRARQSGRLIVGQIASPPPSTEVLRRCDLIVTSLPHFVDRFRAAGIDTEYLPLAFDPVVCDRLRKRGAVPDPDAERPYRASFVGGLNPRTHGRRTALLEHLCAREHVDIWGYGIESLGPSCSILSRYQGEAWALEMYAVLARSRITINSHIDVAAGYSNNMRLYEATGVGALLLTESSKNLSELFKPYAEVVPYAGFEDLIDKIQYYIEHDVERLRVAAAGQARTLRAHTYERRIEQLTTILERRLATSGVIQ